MKTCIAFRIRCQGIGYLPEVYASADLADLALPGAEALERATHGEKGKDGSPRWARVEPVKLIAHDSVAGFAAWPEEPAVAAEEPSAPGPNRAAAALPDMAISAVGRVD
jgi:hypothetical protein